MEEKEAKDRIKARFDKWALDDDECVGFDTAHCQFVLEKQKEQKSAELSDDFEIALEEFLMNADSSSNTYKEDVKKYSKRLREIVGHENDFVRKEWSEEDIKIIDDAYCWLCEYAGSLIQKNYGKSSMLYGIANKFKSLRPQPKQEWSEEDERLKQVAIRACEQVIQDYPNDIIRFRDCISWLKSLKNRGNFSKNNTNSPKEWSDEDEKDIAHIIRILDDCYAYGKHDLSKTDHENLVTTLKSLRPQKKEDLPKWKPSEEQMEALKETIDIEPDYYKPRCTLVTLFNDLKKLKED